MADDVKTQDATDQASGGTAQGGDAQTTTGAQDTGAAPPTGMTQAQVDRIVQERLSRAEAKWQEREAGLQAELETHRKAEEERQQAEMTEVERAKAEAEKARADAQAALATAEQERLRATRADLISQQAPDLPAAYKQLISGADEDAITASIAEARNAYLADERAALERVLDLPAEQLKARYGPEGAQALADRLAGLPRNVGAPSNAGNQPQVPADWGQGNDSQQAWIRERGRLGLRDVPGFPTKE